MPLRATRLFNESDLLKLPHWGGTIQSLRHVRGYLCVTGVTVFVCLLALLSGTAFGASQAKRVAFRVTLKATITKDWNTAAELSENGCQTSKHFVGRRTIKLRSVRPTTVFVTFRNGRVSYSPNAIRFVRLEITQSGNRTSKVLAPCEPSSEHVDCSRTRRVLTGARFGFFRSRRNEISFYRTRFPEVPYSCLRESASVRAIRPGLQQAEGELSEAVLADPRISTQTAYATAEVTSDLDDQETGRVVERVSWELTFTRKR